MNKNDPRIEEIFKKADELKKSGGQEYEKLVDAIKKKVASMEDGVKISKFYKEFAYQLKIERAKTQNINEGLGDALRKMTLGAMLATCIANPAYAKVIVDNIQTHHPVTAKYESGDKGYDCIVKDNYGGYSYGKDQISTERRNGKPSTFDYFMKYAKEKDPNIEYHLRKAGGWEAANKGDPTFIAKWCEMTFRKDFQNVYDGFMKDREFIPVYQRMDNQKHGKFDKITTWASNNKGVQAAINSAIIQHGKSGSFNLMNKIVQNKNIKTPEDFVKALYNARATKFPQFKSRYKSELADVQKYMKSGNIKI